MIIKHTQRPVRLLSEELTNQIAAGEVVERPASVLKELLENSLDAEANRIQVEISDGGNSLIRVVDDGWGMGVDDLLLSLEHHATSKVFSSEELTRILTMGFRGEALPSIAAVSCLKLRSRLRNAEYGIEIQVVGGTIREVIEVGCSEGTQVEVTNLFYNTPVRKKFLKSKATEVGRLGQVLVRLALARPEVALRYTSEGQVIYNLPAAISITERAAAILGRDFVEQMIYMDEHEESLVVTGLIGQPSLTRLTSNQIFTFVNERFVHNRMLRSAICHAYKGLLHSNRFPVCIIYINLDPELVDVNVHPTKIEVRFCYSKKVCLALTKTVRRALARAQSVLVTRQVVQVNTHKTIKQSNVDCTFSVDLVQSKKKIIESQLTPISASNSLTTSKSFSLVKSFITDNSQPQPLFSLPDELVVIGQFHGLYIICSLPTGLVIVDQHAAHERLIYNMLCSQQQKGKPIPCQRLLNPVNLELTPQEVVWVKQQRDDWERLGLDLAHFGGYTWSINAIPVFLIGCDPVVLVRDLLTKMYISGLLPDTPDFLEKAMRILACQSSLRQGQRLSLTEMRNLVQRIVKIPPPVTCPHGRPVFLLLRQCDVARYFKRNSKKSV